MNANLELPRNGPRTRRSPSHDVLQRVVRLHFANQNVSRTAGLFGPLRYLFHQEHQMVLSLARKGAYGHNSWRRYIMTLLATEDTCDLSSPFRNEARYSLDGPLPFPPRSRTRPHLHLASVPRLALGAVSVVQGLPAGGQAQQDFGPLTQACRIFQVEQQHPFFR